MSLKFKGFFPEREASIVKKLAGLDSIEEGSASGEGVSFMVGTSELFVPLGGLVDTAEEIAKAEKDLEYQKRFLASVRGKLSNEAFTSRAPEAVVANERQKEADALSRIASLEAQLASLKGI